MSNEQTRDNLTISTRLIYNEMIASRTPVTIVSDTSNILEYSDARGDSHLLFSTCSDKSSAAGKAIADSKVKTAHIASTLNIPMPASIACRDIREARAFLAEHDMIVIKPARGSSGGGVSTDIRTDPPLLHAYNYAKKYSHTILAQQHIVGDDVRLLVVGGVFCSAVIRQPAHVVGDGSSSIQQLISYANADISRNDTTISSLMHINIHAARRFLGESINTIPRRGSEVRVVGPANVSLGGSLHEATSVVTPAMVVDAEKITNKLGLGVCGVDMMWDRKTGKHYLIEVNATPGIDIHDDTFSGTSSNAARKYVQWLVQ
ncbi:MAG: ATP-grasp domain-containing protein [Candidatus Saccharimonadales bacterium]